MTSKMIILIGSLFMITKSVYSLKPISEYLDLKTFCVLFALPGRENGPYIEEFRVHLKTQLDKVGKDIFNSSDHSVRMKEAGKMCTFRNSFTPKCAYYRIATIGVKLIDDLKRLEKKMIPNYKNSELMYTTLLNTWYSDKVFLDLKCSSVDVKKPRPIFQWKYVASWSKLFLSRQEFCTWSKPLDGDVAKNIRQEVKTICGSIDTSAICHLQQILDLVDSVDQLCNLVPLSNWKLNSPDFKYYQAAIFINFYSMKVKTSTDIYGTFNVNLTEGVVQKGILDIFYKLYEDFRANDLSLSKNLLKVLPKTMYMPCDYNAPFPSFKWSICSAIKAFDQLRLYIETYENGKVNRSRKILTSKIDVREYIKNLKASQIKELTEQNAVNLQVVAASIQNSIQERFQQLGNYFRQTATYQTKKLGADVAYINGRIEEYKNTFNGYVQQLQTKIRILLGLFTVSAAAQLGEAIAKMTIRISMAGNPLKWLTDGGNADDIMESASEIAEASRLLTEAIRSIVHFPRLVEYSQSLALKLKKNEAMLRNVKAILDKAGIVVNTSSKGFEAQQSKFLEDYNNYAPQVTKGMLAKLNTYWNLFINEICEGLESTSGVVANSIKGIGNSRGVCRDAEIAASQLGATQEEIYDLQFELIEEMANMMGSLTQIQSSNILGKGPRVKNPQTLSTESLKMLIAVSFISYNILQTTNVQMLCNIMEYKHGKRPDLCNGLATNIDKLLALKDPVCSAESTYLIVSTQPTGKTGDYSWLDINRLYKGETVPFQVPNSQWLLDHKLITSSEIHDNFYLSMLEIFMPTRSRNTRLVNIQITPTTTDNKLGQDPRTNYIISPLKPIADRLRMKYVEGLGARCRKRGISNPYFTCGSNFRPFFTKICVTSTYGGTEKDILLPSLYSKFHLRIEGYENLNLSEPVTNPHVHIGIHFCSVTSKRGKRHARRTKRNFRTPKCCSGDKSYFDEGSQKCKTCPNGSKSFYNSLFCGRVIDIRIVNNTAEDLTYDTAVNLCEKYGSTIASSKLFEEAKDLAQASCVCGWLGGSKIDSLTPKSQCTDKSPCNQNKAKYVHCKAIYAT